MTASDTTRSILDAAISRHDFALAGVATLEPSDFSDEFRDWLAHGKHGEMGYLANNLDVRLNPANLMEGARSAVVVADLYATRRNNH